ncbi:16S rRNA (adenine(1518)-N(6)/adenine(1519)-N(6))-dimethyltransferase RsmA [Porcipelethomonas sp.]|uniref:16S rRNA (adenine(1518)-N(6)/adenine(1519)-N(6))- dimethyltransferase RsmA n=1 Tax=Porcipelethomonas sp. TaxID=2981675 RepID=UPI003EF4DD7A
MKNLTNISVIKELLEKYGFKFSKGLGQNFLINPSVCPKIAEYGLAKEGYGIIEIGTGFGTLSCELAKGADKVVAVEIDSRLIPVLDETMSEFDNFKVINADIMETDLNALIKDEFDGLKVAVCANLPYYITSPVIMKLLESEIPVDAITVMVQKEAAGRLCAKMGTRESGAITAAVNYYGTAELLFNVSRGSFMPAPNVDSAVIQIKPDNKYRNKIHDKSLYFKVIKGAFAQRRKTLANSLNSAMGIEKEKIYDILREIDLPETARCEQLTMDNWTEFVNILKNII